MRVVDLLGELGGNVTGRVVVEDAVERDDIMVLDGLADVGPAELCIKRGQVLEHLPPRPEYSSDHIIPVSCSGT